MLTIAVVPEIITIGVVGAIVVALAIVGAAAVVAIKPEYLTLVSVGLPVQFVKTPLVGVPKIGVTKVMLVLVQAEISPLATVPSTGVTKVGLVANTKEPLPVSSVTAVFKLADVGVPKKVATPVPRLVMPVPPLAADKVPVTPVVKGKPVQFVSVPDAGVPNVGVTKAGLVNKVAIESCLVVLVEACTIGNTSALACEDATGNAEMAIVVIVNP
jgi:hypothetical protein